jgi:2-polyprenyl-6-methoxyphenol hydroxylase-like FAD-dependent oxidoreductase
LSRITQLLPPSIGDIYSTSVNANIGVLDGAAILDAVTGTKINQVGGVPKGQPGHILRCRRGNLHHFLQQNLPITTGKQFNNYTEDVQGVTAHFTDGTTARGSILVGTDGASSRVRSQLLGLSAKLAPFIPIMGSVTLPREKYTHIHELGSAGIMAGKKDLRYMNALLSIQPDRSSADYYYGVCYQPSDPESETAWAHNASKEELYNKALTLTKDIPAFLTDIIRSSGPEGIVTPQLKFLEFMPPDTLPTGRVTLAGDAAHAMMPFQGAGANTAFLDICDLASLLIGNKATPALARQTQNQNQDQDQITSLLQQYARIICPRGRESVSGSHAATKDMSKLLGADKNTKPPPPIPSTQVIVQAVPEVQAAAAEKARGLWSDIMSLVKQGLRMFYSMVIKS